MLLHVDKQSHNFIEFTLEAPVEYANAIRRTIMSDIPTEAFDEIEISKNTTCIDNDMLAQRIALIPTTKGKETKLSYQLNNDTDETIEVFSHDLSEHLVPNIYLISVRPTEMLYLTASTKMGVGYTNSKWSCVTDLCYRQHRELNGILTPDESKKIQRIIPQFNMRQLTEFIDTNLIFMINQICERNVFSLKLQPKFTISFSTIDGSDPKNRLHMAITQLIQHTMHPKLKGNKLQTNDYAIPNLLILEHPDKNFTCIKQHNLDTFFTLSSLDQLQTAQKTIIENFRRFRVELG